jgi:hypothetical protein
MKTKRLSIILCLLLACSFVQAQKVKDEDIHFKYKRLPLTPIDKKYTNYQAVVLLDYVAEDIAKQAEYDSKNNLANETYAKEKKEAAEKYAKEKEDYKKKSLGSKIAEQALLGQNNKPTQEWVSKEQVDKPYIRKVADANLLSTTYVILDGFKKQADNAVIVQFISHGFEWQPITVKELTNFSGGATKKVYAPTINYRHPVTIKILSPDGKAVLWEAPVAESNKYSEWTTSTNYDTKELAERAGQNQSILTALEIPCLDNSMKNANIYLNQQCGFTTTERVAVLNNIEGKKFDYSDYAAAYVDAAEAYMQIIDNPEEAKSKLLKSLEKWENAMKESTPKEKKSRVDNDVTFATIWNMAEAYMWINEYAKAKAILVKTAVLDLNNREERKLEALKTFIDDQRTRFDLNK